MFPLLPVESNLEESPSLPESYPGPIYKQMLYPASFLDIQRDRLTQPYINLEKETVNDSSVSCQDPVKISP